MKRDSVLGLVLSAFLGSLFSYVLPKLADALIPAFKGNALAEHPAETCMVAAFCACLGFMVGRASKVGSTDRSDAWRQKRERRRELMAMQHESYEKAKTSVKNLDIDMKALMKVAADGNTAYYRKDDFMAGIMSDPFIAQFLETESVDGGLVKVTATPLLAEFDEESPELLTSASQTAESHRKERDDCTVYYSGFSNAAAPFQSAAPYWWWYGE